MWLARRRHPRTSSGAVALLDPIPGFRFSAARAGLKANALDVGIIVADQPASAAAVVTQNRLRAPPVDITVDRVRDGKLQAVLVNSGNANAATGTAGTEAALVTTAALARRLQISPEQVAPVSTGVIGVPLKVDRVVGAVDTLVRDLAPEAIGPFSESILTTDKGPKVTRRTITVDGRDHTILVVAKGAGMIHPQMATTLAFVVTDVPCRPGDLDTALRTATDLTFNRISVDGDTSTNDTIIALAPPVEREGTAAGQHHVGPGFVERLTDALDEVAIMIVADGEGAQHAVRILVEGAVSDGHAVQVAMTIATSSLVKTALHGCDPNWGRILAAAGRSGVDFSPAAATIHIGDVPVYERGTPMDAQLEASACGVMKAARYDIHVRLGDGDGRGWYWTCDLGHEYVTINADYRT